MRPLRLARIAIEAERLRLRYLGRRLAMRLVLAVVALMLLLAALIFGQLGAWYWLCESVAPDRVALILAAADLLAAAILGLAAARWAPGRIEREARAVRQRALDSAADAVSLATLLARLLVVLLRPRDRPPP